MVNKTPLVLLPGMLCDAALWRSQIEVLSPIAPITVADLTREESIEGMAKTVLDQAPDTFALAGLSMGGYVAQDIMRRAPERVTRLALLDTSARGDTPENMEKRRSYIELAKRGDFKGVTQRLLPLFVHPERLDDDDLMSAIQDMTQRVGRDAYLRQQEAILYRREGLSDLGAVACPTLVLCGRQDVLTPLEHHQEIAAAIPGATLVVIEDCGHLSTMERPEEVNAAMRDWLLAD